MPYVPNINKIRMSQFTVRIPVSVADRARSKIDGVELRSMSQIVAVALEHWLQEGGKNETKR